MEAGGENQGVETPDMPELPNVFAQTNDIFGFVEDYNDGASRVDPDDYSSREDNVDEDLPYHSTPVPPTPPAPDATPPTCPTPHLPTNNHPHPPRLVTPAKPKKTPDPQRSKIAQEREQKKREQKVAEASKEKHQGQTRQATSSAEETSIRQANIKLILKKLEKLGISMGDVICYFFDPENSCDRYEGFWKNPTYFDDLMACITTRKNATPTGRERIHRWAIDHVKRTVRSEAQAITTSKCLQSRHLPIDEDFVLGFRLRDLEDKLAEFCPVMLEMSVWFGTSTAQERAMKKSEEKMFTTKLHKRKVAVTALLSLLRVVVTYTSLVRTTPRPRHQTEEVESVGNHQVPTERIRERLGLLIELSLALQAKARLMVLAVVVAIAYDNINFTSRVGEQTIRHTDTQENRTCATLYVVPGVSKEDLDVNAYHEKLQSARPLKLDDLALTLEEYKIEQESIVQTILGVLIEHGGEFFSRYKNLLGSELPDLCPAGAYTLYPLPAMNVNEGSVDGNIDVFETITKELTPSGGPINPGFVKMLLGDQLSMAFSRKAITWRVGNEDAASSMWDIILGPGLFHLEMIFAFLILENSWGLPNSEANPGSLSAHNTLLGRRPIVISSPPKFRDAMDLITVSLHARILCTLPLAAGKKNMEEYMHTLAQLDGLKPRDFKKSYEQLKSDIRKQMKLYADVKVAARLRKEREAADKSADATSPNNPSNSSSEPPNPSPPPAGDMVFESGVLFFNLALRLRNFVEAIRSGNSDRIVVILKTLVLAFRGTRHTKYAYETVVFLHNYQHVWPVPLR
ncbi:hypothetical protein FRC06_009225 [Ceratobasidium sp. 370]|nr:hypothetical protein FRC06_009225 [Ceratobasidium sp. 370]